MLGAHDEIAGGRDAKSTNSGPLSAPQGRVSYSVEINSKSDATKAARLRGGVNAIVSAVTCRGGGDRVGFDRNVTIKAVDRGFELSSRCSLTPTQVDVGDLIAKLDFFYSNDMLETCFPSNMEDTIDRMLRMYDDLH